MKNILMLFLFIFLAAQLMITPYALSNNKSNKKEIVKIAVSKANELGYKTEEMNVTYDDNNVKIRTHLAGRNTPEQEYPELRGKDYQSVYLSPRQVGVKGGDLWVFVDRDTGEVIKYVGGK